MEPLTIGCRNGRDAGPCVLLNKTDSQLGSTQSSRGRLYGCRLVGIDRLDLYESRYPYQLLTFHYGWCLFLDLSVHTLARLTHSFYWTTSRASPSFTPTQTVFIRFYKVVSPWILSSIPSNVRPQRCLSCPHSRPGQDALRSVVVTMCTLSPTG